MIEFIGILIIICCVIYFFYKEVAMNSENWTPLINIRGVDKYSRRPKRIRFPDGHTVWVSYWIDVLRATAIWLVDNGRLTPENARLRHPNVRDLYVSFSREQQHPSGRQFKNPEEIDVGVYIENNWIAQDSVNGAKGLLEHCGVDPSTVQIID